MLVSFIFKFRRVSTGSLSGIKILNQFNIKEQISNFIIKKVNNNNLKQASFMNHYIDMY